MSPVSLGMGEEWQDYPPVRHDTQRPQPLADKDCYLPRPEIGPDVATFVAAGTEIPRGLEDRERHSEWPPRKRGAK